ncbi:IS3 family transposase [Pseudomonas sp. NPDC086251]|uniref:IS3 family transposase n=1 Tax=Pseudomonas sp. NPDC086251 TaxID=3364431 RepID=UPI003837BBD6
MIDGVRGALSIRHACSVLGVARSSFYAKRKPTLPPAIDKDLELRIRALHKEHRDALGARGLSKELKIAGVFIGRHRMRSLIKTLNLATSTNLCALSSRHQAWSYGTEHTRSSL